MKKVTCLCVVALCGAVGAVEWGLQGEGAWTVPGNWKDGAVPAASADVANNAGGTIVVSDGMSVTAARLYLGSVSGTSGALKMTGGTLTLTESASQVGRVAGGSGTVEMTGGALKTVQLQIGSSGTGSMILSGGVVTNTDWSCIGRYRSGVGTMTITGTGLWVNADGGCTLFISEEGTGTLTVENGGEMRFLPGNTSGAILGNQASGQGTLYLKTGGLLTAPYVAVKNAENTFVLDGGTFRSNKEADRANFIYGGGTVEIGPNGGVIDTLSKSQTVQVDINDTEDGAGRLVKQGAGTLVLNGFGSFSGGYDIQAGTVSAFGCGNLPGYATAPITVAAGATLSLGTGWTAGQVQALTNRADFVLADGACFEWTPAPTTGDWVVDVGSGVTQTLGHGLEESRRLVKKGAGTLNLAGVNSFGAGVVVSNGTLRADDLATNLGGANLTLSGTSAGSPAWYATTAETLMAPLGAAAGQISVTGFAGFQGLGRDLTINFGGNGDAVRCTSSAPFGVTDLNLRSNGGTVTLANPLNINGRGFTVKGSTASTVVLQGGIQNDNGTSDGSFYFWDGSLVVPGRAEDAAHTVRALWLFNGSTLFTNATVSVMDVLAGSKTSDGGKSVVTFKNCRATCSGWNYSNGSTGTLMTVDGGSFKGGRIYVGTGYTGRTGDFVLTNTPSLTVTDCIYMYDGAFRMHSGTAEVNKIAVGNWKNNRTAAPTFELHGGRMTLSGTDQRVGAVSNSVGRVLIDGGTLHVNDAKNFQVGAYGKGLVVQTGGAVSCASYPCIGRYKGGEGEYRLHGGTFTHRVQSNNSQLFFIAEEGTGTVSIANGGHLVVTNGSGVQISSKAASKGHLILSPGGTAEVARAFGATAGESEVTFNGGTFKAFSNAHAGDFVNANLKRVTATALGGTVDTAGKGDFTIAKPITAATRADSLSEALVHRWSFTDGSLADLVGTSDAELMGTATYTNGAVRLLGTARGTSCVKLGTDIVPTDGRGMTLEVWFTQNAVKNWARIIDFGKNGSEMYVSFNQGGVSGMQFCVNGVASGLGGYVLKNDVPYHLTVIFDPRLDGSWTCSATLRDATTGACLDRVAFTAPAGWSPAKLTSMATEGCWLGHSSFTADSDPAADYQEVRVCHRVMTDAQIAADIAAGPDMRCFFRKQGAGSLTLTGANAYPCGTAVDAGTLKLADGATLPATACVVASDATMQLNTTEQTVQTLEGSGTVKNGRVVVQGAVRPGGAESVGTLTLDGTVLAGGTLEMDVGADGTSDRLVTTASLDLSALAFRLGDAAALDEKKVYTLVSGPLSGTFTRVENVPARWDVVCTESSVRLVYGAGTKIFIR